MSPWTTSKEEGSGYRHYQSIHNCSAVQNTPRSSVTLREAPSRSAKHCHTPRSTVTLREACHTPRSFYTPLNLLADSQKSCHTPRSSVTLREALSRSAKLCDTPRSFVTPLKALFDRHVIKLSLVTSMSLKLLLNLLAPVPTPRGTTTPSLPSRGALSTPTHVSQLPRLFFHLPRATTSPSSNLLFLFFL